MQPRSKRAETSKLTVEFQKKVGAVVRVKKLHANAMRPRRVDMTLATGSRTNSISASAADGRAAADKWLVYKRVPKPRRLYEHHILYNYWSHFKENSDKMFFSNSELFLSLLCFVFYQLFTIYHLLPLGRAQGRRSLWDRGGHAPQIFGLGDMITNVPPIFLE